MVGRSIKKASLWFALTVILSTSFLGLLPTNTGPQKAFAQADVPSLAEAQAWYNWADDPGAFSLLIPADTDPTNSTPPNVTIPTRGGPTINFKLSKVAGSFTSYTGLGSLAGVIGAWLGSKAGSNVAWAIFEAYDQTSGAKIEHVYLIGDNKGPNWDIYYGSTSTEFTSSHPSGAEKLRTVRLNDDTDRSPHNVNTYHNLYRYVFDEPPQPSHDSCADGVAFKTGPKVGTPPGPVRLTRKAGEVSKLNSNCLETGPEGWGAFWGVLVTSQAPQGDACSLSNIGGVLSNVGSGIFVIFACFASAAFKNALTTLTGIIGGLTNYSDPTKPSSIEQQLNPNNPESNKGFITAWKYVLGLLNIIVILALLAIAFANILHLNINTYAAKKALPGLVLGVIGANASLLLIRFILDLAQALAQLAYGIGNFSGFTDLITSFLGVIGNAVFSNLIANIIALAAAPLTLIIVIIFIIYFFFLILVFAWAMLKRLIIIYGLTIVAPLAFISYGIPSLQHWFTKWWDMFIRQVFVLPIILIGMALFVGVGEAIGFKSFVVTGQGAIDIPALIRAILILGLATTIIQLPKVITKGVLDVSGAAKKAFGMAKATPQTVMMSKPVQGRIKGWAKSDNKFTSLLGRTGKSLSSASAIAANPDKLKDSWEKRQKRGEKNRAIDFSKKTTHDFFAPYPKIKGKPLGFIKEKPIMESVSGRQVGFDDGMDGNRDTINRISDPEKLKDIARGEEDKYVNGLKAFALAHPDTAGLKTDEEKYQFAVDKIINGGSSDQYEFGSGAGAQAGMSGYLSAENVLAMSKLFNEYLRDAQRGQENKGLSVTEKRQVALGHFMEALGLSSATQPPTPPPVIAPPVGGTPFGGSGATPPGSGTPPSGGGKGGPGQRGGPKDPNLTINAGKVDVNTDTEVNVDPNVAARFGRLKDLAGAIKNPTQKQKEDGEMETSDEAEARHIGELEGLSGEWGEFATKSLDSLTTEEQGQLDDLRTRTGQAFDDTIGNSALRAGAEQLLSSSDAGTLQQLTGGLAEVVQHRDMLEKPASLERLIANRSAVGKEASALNEAGGQFVASQDIEKLIGAINGQPEAFASQLQELVEPHYKEMTQALNKQGSTEELKQMTATIVNGWRNAISGRDRRSMASILRTSMTTMGDTVAKQVSYGQLTPNVNVNVEAGKPNVVIQPPSNQAGGSTIINNNISNETTEISNPVSPQSAATESLASELRTRVEPPPTEPPTPPSTP